MRPTPFQSKVFLDTRKRLIEIGLKAGSPPWANKIGGEQKASFLEEVLQAQNGKKSEKDPKECMTYQ